MACWRHRSQFRGRNRRRNDMATQHTFKVTVTGFSDGEVRAWIVALGKTPGVTVADFVPEQARPTLPIPTHASPTAPVAAPDPSTALLTALRAALAKAEGQPVARTMTAPTTHVPPAPFPGANVKPYSNVRGSGFKA